MSAFSTRGMIRIAVATLMAIAVASGVSAQKQDETKLPDQRLQHEIPVGPYSRVNTASGVVTTVIPIVGWKSRGKVGVDVSLCHSSGAIRDSNMQADEVAFNWRLSYNDWLTTDLSYWQTQHADCSAQTWTKNNGSYVRERGVRDTLADNSGGGYVATGKDHISRYYTQQISGRWLLTSIRDSFGNAVTVSHHIDTTNNHYWVSTAVLK